MSYRCVTCGEVHDDLPDLGADRPDIWWSIPAEEREQRIQLTNDTCIVDQENFFIRGVLQIPIHDYPRSFGFGVWVSQKRENFFTYLDNFESDQIGPFFGWLSTRLSYYPEDTTNLKTMAHFRDKEERPLIEVEPSNHPLALDQRTA
jgi:hypothetical protein